MVPSSESNGVLGEALNRLLEETFGTSGSGRINIKALHQLLVSLIELHVRYEEDKQQAKPLETTSTAPEVVVRVNEIPYDDKITELCKGTVSSHEKETSTDEDGSEAKDKQSSSPVTKSLERLGGKEGDAINATQTDEENGMDKALDTTPSSVGDIDATKQQSSDVLIKSTSSSEKFSASSSSSARTESKPSIGDISKPLESLSRKEGEAPTVAQTVEEIIMDKTLDTTPSSIGDISTTKQQCSDSSLGTSSSSKTGSSPASFGGKLASPSLKSSKTPANNRTTQTANEFEAILEGCRNHLEAVKEEVLSLKTRCQSQHEDMLKLAGALDNVVLRVGTQEPKVEKLETDTHCLGMLISEYEVTFRSTAKHLERHDVRVQEFERTFQRMDKERDALRAEVRSINEQVNYLTTVKADKVDVQTELNRRALGTDMQQRVPYTVFNDTGRDLTRMVTQLREELHEVDQNLKTVQYELVKGLGAKASAHDVTQIRKQLAGALGRWQKMEKEQQARTVIMGDSSSSAVTTICDTSSDSSKCLTCGIQTTLEGSRTVVPAKFVPVNRIKHGARNAGGMHTKCVPPEKVFRTGSLGVVKKATQHEKRADQQWKF